MLFQINGMEEHIHILSDLHPSIALADYIRDIKISTSKWMKSSGFFPDFKGWGIKYCALTYSYDDRNTIINYIKNQQEHHKKENFQDEIRRVFRENGIDLEEKWFWVDSWTPTEFLRGVLLSFPELRFAYSGLSMFHT